MFAIFFVSLNANLIYTSMDNPIQEPKMPNPISFNIEAMYFPGFKESITHSHRNLKSVAAAWAKRYAEFLPNDIVVSSKFESLVPPLDENGEIDYHYGTDRIFIDVKLQHNWLDMMNAFIQKNQLWFVERIKEDWTSRNGFLSYMSNTMEGCLHNLEQADERYIGTTLAYMAFKEHGEFWNQINKDLIEPLSISKPHNKKPLRPAPQQDPQQLTMDF